jgi:hypothetical protein
MTRPAISLVFLLLFEACGLDARRAERVAAEVKKK